MSIKALLFDVTAAGSFDGTTQFDLPVTLPAPDVNGQIVIPRTTAGGIIAPESMARIMGVGGYWLRKLSINNQNGAVIRVLIGLQQPKPSITVAGNPITHPLMQQILTINVNAQRQLGGTFVPPGWMIMFFFDDGAGTPIVGPYQVLIELETLRHPSDSARAIRSQSFARRPSTIG